MGCTTKDGYGQVRWNGRTERAHRVAYALAHGPLSPDRPHVLHRCDNRPCCNNAHLFAGTNADNTADRDAKGRVASGARNGNNTRPECRPRGEGSIQAKLTESDIPVVRAALAAKESKTSIARRYGVGWTAIHDIATGHTWKHVPHALELAGEGVGDGE